MRFLLIIFALLYWVKCSKTIRKSPDISSIFSDSKIFFHIVSYLDNPYKSLALLNRDIHDKVMEIKPGKLIADRFNLKEAEKEFNEFDNEAKFFLSISSDYFHHKCMIILQYGAGNLSGKARRLIYLSLSKVLAAAKHAQYAKNELRRYRNAIVNHLLNLECISDVIDLFKSYMTFEIPHYYTDNKILLKLLAMLPNFTAEYLCRFNATHLPVILVYILNFITTEKEFKQAIEVIDHVFINVEHGTNKQWYHTSANHLFESFEKFIVESNTLSILTIENPHLRNSVFIDWISKRRRRPLYLIKASMLHNLNFIRFCSALSNDYLTRITTVAQQILSYNPDKGETVLAAAINTGSLLTFLAVLNCFVEGVKVSRKFKFLLRAQKHICNSLSLETLLALHMDDYSAMFETLHQVGGSVVVKKALNNMMATPDIIDAALPHLNPNDLIHFCIDFAKFIEIFRKVCSGYYKLSLDKWFSYFITLYRKLRETGIPEGYSGSRLIQLNDSLFLKLIDEHVRVFEDTKRIVELEFYWEIRASVLLHLAKPENAALFNCLYMCRSILMGKIAVNLIDLVNEATMQDWTDKLCPLFDIDYKQQFDMTPAPPFLSISRNQVLELETVINGFIPLLKYTAKHDSCRILPYLALKHQADRPKPSNLIRLWSRTSLHSFFISAPDDLIRNMFEREPIVYKWLKTLPTDIEFNLKICRVFLGSEIDLTLEVHSLGDARKLFLETIPFLKSLKTKIEADIIINIYFHDIIRLMNVEEFKELTRIVSHETVTEAFETDKKLRDLRPDLNDLLYDFDFYCFQE